MTKLSDASSKLSDGGGNAMTPKPCPICGQKMQIVVAKARYDKDSVWQLVCYGVCPYWFEVSRSLTKKEGIDLWNKLVGDNPVQEKKK